jgi:hypothetical protein
MIQMLCITGYMVELFIKILILAWWFRPVIPTLRRQKQRIMNLSPAHATL